ncbi:ABC-type transporter, periplasmic subunit family 3 [Alicycliphilus sp. B1]|nr:ABC-type transporter, periplasmic subunit family 3 [Alicycliphilus sp. B1]
MAPGMAPAAGRGATPLTTRDLLAGHGDKAMKKYLAACALVAQGFLHVPVQAQTLEKIKASGAVTMGRAR